jgi:hypothetical protein
MPGSTISVFSEPDDFQAALREAGCSNLLVTEGGPFQARMTKMLLHRIWLSSVEERLSRVAFMCLAPGLVRVSLPTQTGTLICGGIEIRPGEIATHGANGPLHERLRAPCRWGDILLPAQYLARYGRVLLGAAIVVPPGPRLWRPAAEALGRLAALHAAAIRVVGTRPGKAAGAEAARGLEQELIYALVQCLSAGPLDAHAGRADRHARLMARFEEMVTAHPARSLPAGEICSALGVADRTLRSRCRQYLGMGPNRYWRLYRMQLRVAP